MSNNFPKETLENARELLSRIDDFVGKKVVGQHIARRRLLTALLAKGHVLLEGVPGLGKTLLINSLAEAFDSSFRRIQFTPDLLPSDVVGTEIYHQADASFSVRKGPIFANFVLADEINRAPAKVQSALLEAMQEQQVTIGDKSYQTPKPFFVLATQNPVDQEGTYPLPEAQVDRFLLKIIVTYPNKQDEQNMLSAVLNSSSESNNQPVASAEDIIKLQNIATKVHIDKRLEQYIVNIVSATRNSEDTNPEMKDFISLGASPRATLAIYKCSQAEALLCGSDFVLPEHIRSVAADVLRHRIIRSYEADIASISTDEIISQLLDHVAVP